MTTQNHPMFNQHKDETIALCLNCTLPECDEHDPRCPIPAPKRQPRTEKIARRIVETELRRAVGECRR